MTTESYTFRAHPNVTPGVGRTIRHIGTKRTIVHMGPAVVGAAGLPSGATSRLRCYTASGTILWTVTANGYIMRRVAVHAGRVYVATSDGVKIWKLQDGSYVGGYFPAYNVSDVCVHANGTIYIVTRDNATYTITVRALSGTSGNPLWDREFIGLADSDFDSGNRGRVGLNRLGNRLAVIGVSQVYGDAYANLWVLETRHGGVVWRGLTCDSSAGQATAIRWDAASNLYLGDKNGKFIKYRYDGTILQNWISSWNATDVSDIIVDHRYMWLGIERQLNLWRYNLTDLEGEPHWVGWTAGTQMAMNAKNQFYIVYYSAGSDPRDPSLCRINHDGTQGVWLWDNDLLQGSCYSNAGCAVLSTPDVPIWEDDHAYVVGDIVRYGRVTGTSWRYFYCTSPHTSSGDTMPGYGEDWDSVWDEDDWDRYNL